MQNSIQFQNRTCTNGTLSCNVVGLCFEICSQNDVEFFTYLNLSCLKLRLKTYHWCTLGKVFIRVCNLSRMAENELRSISPFSRQTLPYPVQMLHQTRRTSLHASRVMLAVPGIFVGSNSVQSEMEWRFVLPHFSRHVVPPSQLIGKAVPGASKMRSPTPRSASAAKNLILTYGSSGFTKSVGRTSRWHHQRSAHRLFPEGTKSGLYVANNEF